MAGIVRRPDPEPCACCARGDFDMCRNGRYRERGIKELDGYGAELVALEREYAVKLDPTLASVGVLTEPTSVVVKAWEQVERIAEQACRPLERVLVTGAGPIGLLAGLLGVQRGRRVDLLDRAREGPKPELARSLAPATTPARSATRAASRSPTWCSSAPARRSSWWTRCRRRRRRRSSA